jgi:ABC-type molybdate transport system permease subunit
MALPPKLIGPTISLITGLITSTSVSFVGLALNYGFQADFATRWLKAAVTSYVVIVPMLVILVPRIQRFVMRQAENPTREGAASSSFERNPRPAT